MKKIGFIFAITLLPMMVIGQKTSKTSTDGDVVEGEFIINKALEITLPPAQRIVGQVPAEETNQRESEPLTYSFIKYSPNLPDITTRLRVLKLKDTPAKTTLPSYVNFGFGNYLTPLFQAGINTGPGKTSNYGVRFHHLSSVNGPIDKNNSGDSRSNFNIYGKSIGKAVSVDGDLGYNRDTYHFYGYDDGLEVESDTIEQVFNRFKLGVQLANSKPESDVQYKVQAKVFHVSDKFDASELGFLGGFGGEYIINETMRARLNVNMLYTSYKNPETFGRSLLTIFPSFVYSAGGLTIDGGIKVLSHNDTLNYDNSTRVFPSVTVGYDLTDNITAYGSIDGDIHAVTFDMLSMENPYIIEGTNLANTIKTFDLTAGVKGSLLQYVGFDAGFRSALYENMYFYVNNVTQFNKFDVVYDAGTTSLFQIFASMSYLKSSKMGSTLSFKVNGYNPGSLDKAWHVPKFEMNYSLWYNFYDKVKIYTDLFAMTGIRAIDQRSDPSAAITLKGALDLNLKIDYSLSEKMGVFVSMNNILNNNYQIYYRYPTRGLLAIAGVSFSF